MVAPARLGIMGDGEAYWRLLSPGVKFGGEAKKRGFAPSTRVAGRARGAVSIRASRAAALTDGIEAECRCLGWWAPARGRGHNFLQLYGNRGMEVLIRKESCDRFVLVLPVH